MAMNKARVYLWQIVDVILQSPQNCEDLDERHHRCWIGGTGGDAEGEDQAENDFRAVGCEDDVAHDPGLVVATVPVL